MSNVKRYGFAVVSVFLAVLPALVLQHYKFHDVELAFLLFAVALTAWHAGSGPAVLSIVLASFCFDYFFLQPLYSLELGRQDVPALVALIAFAVLSTPGLPQSGAASKQICWPPGTNFSRRWRSEPNRPGRFAVSMRNSRNGPWLSKAVTKNWKRLPTRCPMTFVPLSAIWPDSRSCCRKPPSSKLDDKAQRYMRIILDSAKRMGNLIDDLLAFSRIGRVETQKAAVNLDQLVKEAMGEVQLETHGREYSLENR